MLVCRSLGLIEIEVDGVTVDLGGPVPRRLLAALSAADGAPVADDALAELVWGEEPPAPNTSRVVVSRIRKALGPAGGAALVRTTGGYRLTLSPEQVDHQRFADLVVRGGEQLAAGAAASAIEAFETALALWRGRPWADLADSLFVAGPRARLVELHDVAVEEMQAARLAAGDASGAVAALSAAVTEAPYRERRWELLAIGLYRTGRQAHALAELRRVRELLRDDLGVELGPRLRDLEQRMLNHEPGLLLVESTDRSTASIRVPSGPPPIARPLSSFVGRGVELEVLDSLLSTQRLVTVIGPAGVGKTRLAIEHAGAGPDRWLVRLADVHTADAVAPAIASAIGLAQFGGDPVELLSRTLAGREGLLVLDNCEHLVAPVALLVSRLLAHCPQLRVLATSRRLFGVDGEHVLVVDPLTVTGVDGQDGSAVELLFDRIRTARPGWTPTEDERAAARDVCAMLDGLPLAIELAAARERAFGVAGVAAHLRDRLDVLGPTPHGSISPHASLTAAIGWSVEQLSEHDRSLLLRLWPFEGGFPWLAAQTVSATQIPSGAVLAALASLVERSVVLADVSARPVRYRMLETVRRYCRDADPDPRSSAATHAEWVRGFVAEQSALFIGPRAGDAFRTLAADLPNIRAGVAYDLEHAPALALTTVVQLNWAWAVFGVLPEGARLIRAAMAACDPAPLELRVYGLLALSSIAHHAGDAAEALRLADAASDLLHAHPDPHLAVLVVMAQGQGLFELGDAEAVREIADRVLSATQEFPTLPWIAATAALADGLAHVLAGAREAGLEALARAHATGLACGHYWSQGISDLARAWTELGADDPNPGRARLSLAALRRAQIAFVEQDNKAEVVSVVYAAAHALLDVGHVDPAVQLRAAAIEHAERMGADPTRYSRLGGEPIRRRMAAALQTPDGRRAAEAGCELSWATMLARFDEAVGAGL